MQTFELVHESFLQVFFERCRMLICNSNVSRMTDNWKMNLDFHMTAINAIIRTRQDDNRLLLSNQCIPLRPSSLCGWICEFNITYHLINSARSMLDHQRTKHFKLGSSCCKNHMRFSWQAICLFSVDNMVLLKDVTSCAVSYTHLTLPTIYSV